MPLSKERIIYLLNVYTSQKATVQEEEEMWDWIENLQDDTILKDYVHGIWSVHRSDKHFNQVNWERLFDAVISDNISEEVVSSAKVRHVRIYRVAAAVVILAILSVASYVIFSAKILRKDSNTAELRFDIKAPQKNRATLTLSNGQIIYLDSMGSGTLAAQGGVNVLKINDGKIVYKGSTSEELYNVLANPRGSKTIDMVLADGTHVWLNSGSSIRYPAAFIGNERKVSITGEVYFEVAHNARNPFKVMLPSFNGLQKGEITVIGTHFNVDAYEDESAIKTTLLEGSIVLNVSSTSQVKQTARLKPGQQASIADKLDITNDTNLEEVMAWKNDRFDFGEKTDIETLMRQLARWYDIDVKYAGKINSHFGGSISRNVNVSGVLKLLEATGGAKFKIEGKTVTISP